jgi:hypothetical protein
VRKWRHWLKIFLPIWKTPITRRVANAIADANSADTRQTPDKLDALRT